jgi:hypothetical protein
MTRHRLPAEAFGKRIVCFRRPEVIVPQTNRYLIEIKDTETGAVVICKAADWTDDQRRVFIAQLQRLTGISSESARNEPNQDKGFPQ